MKLWSHRPLSSQCCWYCWTISDRIDFEAAISVEKCRVPTCAIGNSTPTHFSPVLGSSPGSSRNFHIASLPGSLGVATRIMATAPTLLGVVLAITLSCWLDDTLRVAGGGVPQSTTVSTVIITSWLRYCLPVLGVTIRTV
jgi:hypothetical protein